MKASELRIGNIVYHGGKPIELRSVDIYNFDKIEVKFFAIPLTEEWLVKFGFEKDYLWKKQLDGKAILAISMVDNSYGLYYSNYSYLTGSSFHMKGQKIKHVHSLQNLYFALTGEELQIKDHD